MPTATEQNLDAQLRTDNQRTWQELQALALGSDNQRERWSAGLIPLDELAQLAREALFAPLEGQKRWSKFRPSHVRHDLAAHTNHGYPESDMHYEAVEATEISADEWTRAKAIIEIASHASRHEWLRATGEMFKTVLVRHSAVCKRCGASISACSILVRVLWAERPLSREYAL